MRTSFRSRPLPHKARSGFSLLELLAVVAVIAVLLALLLPALMGARGRSRIVQVKVEIGGLTKAIQDFKVKYGVEPPSQITLYETGSNWQSGDPASAAIINRIWPQFDFTINHDFNLNGNHTDTITLYGAECLVFFLGGPSTWIDQSGGTAGVYDAGVDTLVQVSGFSKNPADPLAGPVTSASNRDGPYYTFLPDRFVSAGGNKANFFGYSDPMPGSLVPYLYVSSNEGQGYNSADFGAPLNYPPNLAVNNVYLNGTTASSPAWNPNGFQIISAGLDRKYGGGPTAASPSFGGPYQKGVLTVISGGVTDRDYEMDNITNFSEGVLVP